MRRLFALIFGIPAGAQARNAALAAMIGSRSKDDAIAFLRDGASHNTEKSGALLGGQGIFVVVDIFAMDHGWPRAAVLASLLLLVAGSLVVMTNLRSTLGAYRQSLATPPIDPARAIFNMILWRTVRFNVALYLTFLSIILLGSAALSFVF